MVRQKSMAERGKPEHPENPYNPVSVLRASLVSSEEDDGMKYVSEEKKPLRGFIPPPDVGPVEWVIRPPPSSSNEYSVTQLWGWRTNLERALKRIDEAKVIEITNAHPIEEVRDFCEIRALLNKFTELGMKESCRLLLDYCAVSPEGVQAPYITDQMLDWMKTGGYGGHGKTPLIIASSAGHYEVCELLIDRNASLEASDNNITQSNALAHAACRGHRDIVKLLCQKDPNLIKQKDSGGFDCIDAVEFHLLIFENCNTKMFEKILVTLREYDQRCSYCRAEPAILQTCPCEKERYCGVDCQKKRWKKHKELHNKIMEK